MQGGVDNYQEYPIADPTRLELQLIVPAVARWHVPDVPWRRILGRIRHPVVRMEAPTKPRLLRYLVANEAPYWRAPSESGVSVEPVSYPFNRVGHEQGRDHNTGDDIRWRQACLRAKQQYQP